MWRCKIRGLARGARPARVLCTLYLGYTATLVSPQERIVIEKADQEEAAAAIRPAASAVVEHEQHEQREKTETSMSVGLPATTRKCVADADDAPAVVAPTASPPTDRPTSLSLAKQEANLTDASSVPSSPISKQVGW